MKNIVTVVITALVVLFTVQNFDHVPVYYFGNKPVHIRLIFIIVLSMAIGYFIRYFNGINKEEALKKKCKELMIKHNKLMKKISQDEHSDEEEF
jgi:uncharacterized integral membrane protein